MRWPLGKLLAALVLFVLAAVVCGLLIALPHPISWERWNDRFVMWLHDLRTRWFPVW